MPDRLLATSFFAFGAASCIFAYALIRPWWVLTLVGVSLVVIQWACLGWATRTYRRNNRREGV